MEATWSSLLVAEQVDERHNLREEVLATGHWRDRAALRSLDHAISVNLAQLGMTPADRARLGVETVRVVSKLEALRRDRDVDRGNPS